MRKKIYFASDFHLGLPSRAKSREREGYVVRWLDAIKQDAGAVYLVGDIFDYWFEYGEAVPKGYLRFLGKIAELRGLGIPIYFFTGNHDMWMFGYFEEELGIPVFRKPLTVEWGGKRFYIAHGDGLGPGDRLYKLVKHVFASPFFQWLFARFHPNFGLWLMHVLSHRGREVRAKETVFWGEEKEFLLQYSEWVVRQEDYDFLVFGHRHLPTFHLLSNGCSHYVNLGEWIHYRSYAVFDGERLSLHFFENEEEGRIFGNCGLGE